MSTTWVQTETVCAPSLEAPSHAIAISEVINQQKVDNFKPVYLGNYQHQRKKICVFFNMLLTTFIIFIYFALDKIFSFFTFFVFFLSLFSFKPQTAHRSYYELL